MLPQLLMLKIRKLLSYGFFLGILFASGILFAESGPSQKAEPIIIGGFFEYFTNSVFTSLMISFAIVLVIRWMLRKGVHLVPTTGQACVEGLIDGLGNIFEPIVGAQLFPKILSFLLGYFVFILIQNLSGLLPGIGSIGWSSGDHFAEIFRPMNADLNATLALALIANIAWMYYSVKCVGIRGLYGHVFGNKADKSEISSAVYVFLFLIFFGVGLVESLSILFRVVSLSFRLFGNIFGGENLLHNIYEMSQFLTSEGLGRTDFYGMIYSFSPALAASINWIFSKLGYFLPLPFYFLEFLVGVVQSFVFTLLVAVYIGLICKHEHEPERIGQV